MKKSKEELLKERIEGVKKYGYTWAVKQQIRDMYYSNISFITLAIYMMSIPTIMFPILEGGLPHIILLYFSIENIDNAPLLGPPYITLIPLLFLFLIYCIVHYSDFVDDFIDSFIISIITVLVSIAISLFIYYYILTTASYDNVSVDDGYLFWYLLILGGISLLIDLIFSNYNIKKGKHICQIIALFVVTQLMRLV